MVIWDSSIIHECPYDFVLGATFSSDMLNTFYSDDVQLMLRITGMINDCDMLLYTTAEGLFAVTAQEAKLKYNKFHSLGKSQEIHTLNELMLADNDFKTLQLLRMHIQLNERFCVLIQTILRLVVRLKDVVRSKSYIGDEAVLYSQAKNIYIPNCQVVVSVDIIESTKNCYEDIPIRFEYKNVTKLGFLTHNRIIRESSKLTSCENSYSHSP